MFDNSSSCEYSSQCPSLYECVDQACRHKGLFPLEPSELLGIFFISVTASFASIAGIGGGSVILPLLTFFFNYTQKEAAIMVFFPVCGAALGNFFNLIQQRDPQTDSPIVNIRFALISCPLMFFGSVFGLVFNKFLPGIFLQMISFQAFFIILILTYILIKATLKFLKAAKRDMALENGRRAFKNEKASQLKVIELSLISDENVPNPYDEIKEQNETKIKKKAKPKFQIIPVSNTLLFSCTIGVVAFFIFFFIIRGTPTLKSVLGIAYCKFEYWVLTILLGGICYLVFRFFVSLFLDYSFLKQLQALRPDQKYGSFDEIKYNYQMEPMKAGITNAVGLGGGMYLIPMYLSFGFSSIQTTGTSSFNVLLTSSLLVYQVLMIGLVPFSLAAQYFLVTMAGTFIGSKLIFVILTKFDRLSIIMWGLVVLNAFSIFALYYKFFVNWAQKNYILSELYNFKEFC